MFLLSEDAIAEASKMLQQAKKGGGFYFIQRI